MLFEGLFLLQMLASRIPGRESVFLYGDDDIFVDTEYLMDVSWRQLLKILQRNSY